MTLNDMITKRQSCRNFSDEELKPEIMDEIREFIENTPALNDSIKYSYDILSNEEVMNLGGWKAPHYLALFSEKKDEYLENIGFVFQQVDLFLHSIGISSCWLGMGKLKNSYKQKNPDETFIIVIAFGKSKDELYRDINSFIRVKLEDISDTEDPKLLPALYAPSATNSQPWYFVSVDENTYRVYRKKQPLLVRKILDKWNHIDIGIALAHLYIANPDTFKYEYEKTGKDINNYYYEGKISL